MENSISSLKCMNSAILSFKHLYSTSGEHDLIKIPFNMIHFLAQNSKLYFHHIQNVQLLLETIYQTVLSSFDEEMTEYQYNNLRSRVHIKLVYFPFSKNLYKTLDGLGEKDLSQWIIIQGKIIRALKKTLQKSKLFKCTSCGYIERLYSTYHNNYTFQLPKGCPNLVEKSKNQNMITKLFQKINFNKKRANSSKHQKKQQLQKKQARCNNKKFQPVQDTEIPQNKIFVSYQQLKIQEPFKHITTRGRIPHTITVILEGLFDEQYRPGEDIVISGLLTSRYFKMIKGIKLQQEMVIAANSIIVKKLHKSRQFEEDNDEETILSSLTNYNLSFTIESDSFLDAEISKRNHIISLFCPNIYQRQYIKLGILLCALGGVNHIVSNTKIRGQSHLLLVGQPGTGKSVLLKAAADLSQRSFFTNGISSSTAGLTVSHVKCRNQWMIEAGALVLADNGICCIDQMNLMPVKDQESLLEAMEQQTVSSAKAGIIGKLNCRTTVLAACNPIRPGQKYDQSLSMSVNSGLIVPLITRFDLVLVLNDTPNIAEDSDKCDHLLGRFLQKQDSYQETKQQKKEMITLKMIMRRSRSFQPRILQQQMLTKYFIKIRQKNYEKTARAFQSLCRLSQAHAKLMFRSETTPFDCMSVMMLMEGWYGGSLQQYKQCQRKIKTILN